MSARASCPPRRILLVEDHVDSADIMARLLKLDGHEVVVAHTLATAKQLCEGSSFDVIFCDIGLPDGSGLDLAPRGAHPCSAAKLIALTAYGMPTEIEDVRAAGFHAHVLKPCTVDALLVHLV